MQDTELSLKSIVAQWTRDIRAYAREWVRDYEPPEDIYPLTHVQDSFYAWLMEEHFTLIDLALKMPIFTQAFTWHMVKKDITKVLEDRGWVPYPNKNGDKPNVDPRDSQWILIRDPRPEDDLAYIELVIDRIKEAKIPRVIQMEQNAIRRRGDLEHKIAMLQKLAEEKRQQQKRRRR